MKSSIMCFVAITAHITNWSHLCMLVGSIKNKHDIIHDIICIIIILTKRIDNKYAFKQNVCWLLIKQIFCWLCCNHKNNEYALIVSLFNDFFDVLENTKIITMFIDILLTCFFWRTNTMIVVLAIILTHDALVYHYITNYVSFRMTNIGWRKVNAWLTKFLAVATRWQLMITS